MLKIEGKTFMNIQEAVQWLLDNNALPFQSSANYVANTEIGLGTIVNPTPAKVRIGSLIFFADSKVSTVTGLTENGFICSDQYNNLVDDVAYVTNVSINVSGHLITTLSDGQTIDAGLIKQVVSFVINDSQHLIVTYNDGSTADLGAIFSGNINIAGNLTANSIIENMAGYSAVVSPTKDASITLNIAYCGVVKNGNKVTFALAGSINRATGGVAGSDIVNYTIPVAVGAQLYPMIIDGTDGLSFKELYCASGFNAGVNCKLRLNKLGNNLLKLEFYSLTNLTEETDYIFRYEDTFLLSDSLI